MGVHSMKQSAGIIALGFCPQNLIIMREELNVKPILYIENLTKIYGKAPSLTVLQPSSGLQTAVSK